LNDECKDYLNRIQHASELMAQLIDDMLRLSRITRTEMAFQKVDLSELARVICANLKNQAPQRKIVFKIAPGLTAVGDGKLLSLALENLFENAVKFTGNVPAAIIEFGVTQKGGQQVYFISDNGVGFDMTYVNKLFKPFQRLHTIAEFPGTGIGLASVQRIIERHGGRVWAEAKVGQGAVFYFTLGGNSGTII
jgi:signal transduction histidine kinase